MTEQTLEIVVSIITINIIKYVRQVAALSRVLCRPSAASCRHGVLVIYWLELFNITSAGLFQ